MLFNEYFDSATFAPLAPPRAGEECRRCAECASAIIAAERERDEATVARLNAEIDVHIFGLYDEHAR